MKWLTTSILSKLSYIYRESTWGPNWTQRKKKERIKRWFSDNDFFFYLKREKFSPSRLIDIGTIISEKSSLSSRRTMVVWRSFIILHGLERSWNVLKWIWKLNCLILKKSSKFNLDLLKPYIVSRILNLKVFNDLRL